MVSILRLLSAIIPFFITVLIANLLETQDAGTFFSAYSLALFVSTLIRLGVDEQVLIISSNQTQSLIETLRQIYSLLILPLILGIAWALIVLACYFFDFLQSKALAEVLLIFALIPLVTLFSTVVAIIFQGKGNYLISILGLSFLMPFTSILLMLFSFNEVGLIEVSYYILFATLLNTIVMMAILVLKVKQQDISNIKNENKIVVTNKKLDLRYAVNSFVAVFFVQAPIFIAGFVLASEDVTNIALASRLSQTLVLLLLVVNFTFAPSARRLFEKNMNRELVILWKKKSFLLCCLGILASLVFWTLVYNNELFKKFVVVDNLVLLISWLTQVIAISFGPIGFLMIMSNQIKTLASIGIAVVVFTLLTILIAYQWMTIYLYSVIFLCAITSMKSMQTFFALNKLKAS